MSKSSILPSALTIAGSDSSGGAGIQVDMKTFAALGVHGTCAVTCITAQSPERILEVEACSPEIVRKQIEAVLSELPPAAIKTGVLYSAEIIQAVVDLFCLSHRLLLVVDPVVIATSGKRLLSPAAIKVMREGLLPLALLVTPNLDEVDALLDWRPTSVEDMRAAAREIHRRFGCAALVKGGHLRGVKAAVDIFNDGKTELLLSAPFIPKLRAHGTGCTYSAAITAYLALGFDLPTAVTKAKEHITQAISRYQKVANHVILNNFWQ